MMNKNIKKLAIEAGFMAWTDEEWNPGDTIDWSSRYDDEFVKYTELLIEDVFARIRSISETEAVVTYEDLKTMILEEFGDDDEK